MSAGMESYVAVIALVIIAALAVFIIRRIRKEHGERVRTLQEFGFMECEPADPEVVESITKLTDPRNSTAHVKRLYRRQQGTFDLYLADFDRTGDSESSQSDTTVIISPNAAVPRFTVIPHVPGTGRMSAIANSILTQFARRPGLEEVTFRQDSQFAKRYALFAPEAESILSDLPPEIWERLAELPQLLSIEAGGDAITFSVLLQNARSTRYNFENLREYIRTHVELAERIQGIFIHGRTRQSIAAGRLT